MEEGFFITDEMIQEQHRMAATLAGEIEKLILGEEKESFDINQYVYIEHSINYFNLVKRIFETRQTLRSRLRVPCRYEIYAVMKALLISIGGMSEQEIPPADSEDRFYDYDWIMEMASVFHEHYKKTAAKGNCVIT